MLRGRFHVKGVLTNTSPLAIGSGQNEATDNDILRDAAGQAYIPATSFMGVLKDLIQQHHGSESEAFQRFFGQDFQNSDHRDTWGSAIDCADLSLRAPGTVSVRDGIKIDAKTGLVIEGAKYDYQVLEPQAEFELNLVLRYQSAEEKRFAEVLMATLTAVLSQQQFYLGAKSNKGLGRMQTKQDLAIFHYDFSVAKDVFAWFRRNKAETYRLDKPVSLQAPHVFTVRAYVSIDNALMIRSFPHQNDYQSLPDDIQLHSAGNPVVPGSSLRGALRHRALKIVNTLGISETLLNEMFGEVDEDKKTAIKGRLQTQETQLKNTTLQQQTRIRIDRFTGGTIDAGLFQVMPVFQRSSESESHTLLEMSLKNYRPEEVGLLMLLLKDLFTGHLAVGGEKNIGRGRFTGKRVTLSWRDHQEEYHIDFQDFAALSDTEKHQLEAFVEALQAQRGAIV